MSSFVSRKKFIHFLSFGTAALIMRPMKSNGQVGEKPPAIKPELVKEFVVQGHRDLTRVKELLVQEPGLLNASWDWGGGDYEAAIEGAGHVGNREIANFLLTSGARMNIFCATMLGKTDLVKAALTAYPGLKTSKGPHGLQLIHHAKKGGEDAREVLEYLQSIGAA